MIERFYSTSLAHAIHPNRVLVIYGPRRVGKTTLIQEFLSTYHGKVFASTGEDATVRDVLESDRFDRIISFFTGYDLVVIDEAQHIRHVGRGLKILVDQIPGIQIIATGSSSFALSNSLGEPLVGRQTIFQLFPIAVLELAKTHGALFVEQHLEQLLIFGSYPDVITHQSREGKIEYLFQIRDSYLYKDILELERIRNAKKILDLLRLIAFQIGNEVSLEELGAQLGMSRNTVERYLDLLEKAFVLINVRGFSRNARNEITKKSRYYFYDTGVRNAIIGNFNLLNSRDDVGQLWENFIFIERLKKRTYQRLHANHFFWRTWSQQEIDIVEEHDGKLFGYECKWTEKNVRPPREWVRTYPTASFEVIHRNNYLNFIL